MGPPAFNYNLPGWALLLSIVTALVGPLQLSIITSLVEPLDLRELCETPKAQDAEEADDRVLELLDLDPAALGGAAQGDDEARRLGKCAKHLIHQFAAAVEATARRRGAESERYPN